MPLQRFSRAALAAVVTTTWILASSPALPAATPGRDVAPAGAASARKTFDLPAGPASESVKRFIAQSEVQLLFAADELAGVRTNALKGEYSVREAIDRLLEGTPLVAVQTPNGSIAIKRAAGPNGNRPQPTETAAVAKSPARGAAVAADAETITLPEFSVSAAQTQGWRTTNTLSGTRINTDLMTLPKPISVLTSEFLEDIGATSLVDAMNYVTNVSATAPDNPVFGLNEFSVRGFRSRRHYKDGNVQVNTVLADAAAFERIEVLKGPSSILAGATSPGGVINYITKKPLKQPRHRLDFTVGDNHLYRGVVDTTGSITSDGRIAYRLIAVYEDKESWQEYVDSEKYMIHPVISWRLLPNTIYTVNFNKTLSEGRSGSFDPARSDQTGWRTDLPWSYNPHGPDTVLERDYMEHNHEVQHRFSEALSARVVFSYQENGIVDIRPTWQNERYLDAANTLLGRNTTTGQATWDRDDNEFWGYQASLVGKLSYGGVNHAFNLGAERYELYRERVRYDKLSGLPVVNVTTRVPLRLGFPNGFTTLNSGGRDNKEVREGLYMLNIVDAFDKKLTALAGARFDRGSGRDQRPNAAPSFSDEDATTFTGGISWSPTSRFTAYATYSESFFPQIGSTFDGTPYEPEVGEGIDVGIRTLFLDGRASLNVGVFDMDRTNLLRADPAHPGFNIQSGLETSRGFEVESQLAVLDNWDAFVGYGYTDAFVAGTGATLQEVPRHTVRVMTKYTIPRGLLKNVSLRVGATHESDKQGNSPRFNVPGFSRYDAGLAYRRKIGRVDTNYAFQVFNVTNELYHPGYRFKAAPREWRFSFGTTF